MGLKAEHAGARGDRSGTEAGPSVASGWRSWVHVVGRELRIHSPYTLLGTVGGVVLLCLLSVSGAPRSLSQTLFWTFHPLHVLLSALVTAGIFRLHRRSGVWATLLVGYVGSVGIATLSDSVIPFVGEYWLEFPHRAIHWGFIEKWWLVNPLAVLGSLVAIWRPHTKFPHAGHVWLSSWASLFHMTMAVDAGMTWTTLIVIPAFLFLAVWIPCCTSDIVFPLLFASSQEIPSPPATRSGTPRRRRESTEGEVRSCR